MILSILDFLWNDQGTNARKVISEVYTFFVLQMQCTVFGRKSKHKTDVTLTASHGIHFHKKNSMKYSGHMMI